MAIENRITVYVNGINLTHYTVMPLKWGNFLDEQLDEMYLSLRHGPFEHIKPLTPVEIHFKNRFYFGSTTVDTQTRVKRFLVANDNSEESPVGSKRYNHDLYLIEVTKFAECVVVDTITFTNDLGREYLLHPSAIVPTAFMDSTPIENPNFVKTISTYVTPQKSNSSFTCVSINDIYRDASGTVNKYFLLSSHNGQSSYLRVSYNSQQIANIENLTDSYTIENMQGGTYTIEYGFWREMQYSGNSVYEFDTVTYGFSVVQNYYPLKQWTITDVINRLLDLAEPLRQGERPRFILQGINPSTGAIQANSQAARFDKILAPQFSFTKQTLRECLKEIGGVVHGEPRLDIAQDSDGNYYYEVSFDLYGQTDRAGIYAKPYIQKTVSQVIDSYASCLDSNAENLVNQLDKLAGVIVEPYAGGYKTVRTETMYARITDANMLIQTQYPIYTIEKLECGFIPGNSDLGQNIDITPYVFESSIYNTRLSSYAELYPYSKAYGIMYTQGQKNLTALNFKLDDAFAPAFENYAIVNILRSATGNQSLNVSDYPLLAFRVTYTPFYNSRVGQTKVNYQDYPRAAALIYNQQANVIESRYYGENLKGVIARLGNVDKSITYNLARLSDIPKAGQMYNDDYYISTVAVEFLPTYIKCTIGLSKDFNRLSQYIGISSVKRYSEVSQGQAVERNTLWKEYIEVGDIRLADDDCHIGNNFIEAIADTFTQNSTYKPLTNVIAWGRTYWRNESEVTSDVSVEYSLLTWWLQIRNQKDKNIKVQLKINGKIVENVYRVTGDSINYSVGGVTDTVEVIAAYETESSLIPAANLPVVSSAFGNSVAFSWAYEDNYSAGAVSQYAESGGENNKVTGYFQNNYQYTDYYGRIYYYNFDLQEAGEQITSEAQQQQIGKALPQGEAVSSSSGYISTLEDKALILRKDNREKLQCNFQVDFVSNRNGLIIGSALAAYNPLVRGVNSSLEAMLYVFDEPLNKFIYHAESSLNIDMSTMEAYDIEVEYLPTGYVTVSSANFAVSGKAWAIITSPYERTTTVEDEQGNVTTQTVQYGGDVLIAQNMDISAGDAFPTVYFTKKREVFDKSVWIANR